MSHTELKPCPFCGGLLGTGDDSQGHDADCYIVLLLGMAHGRDVGVPALTAAWERRAPAFTSEQSGALFVAARALDDECREEDAAVIRRMLDGAAAGVRTPGEGRHGT